VCLSTALQLRHGTSGRCTGRSNAEARRHAILLAHGRANTLRRKGIGRPEPFPGSGIETRGGLFSTFPDVIGPRVGVDFRTAFANFRVLSKLL